MPRFWKQRHDDQLEQLLRANRPEPRDQFLATALERIESKQRRLRPQRLTARILLAGGLTALVLAAAAAAGGAHTVATSVTGLVNVAQEGVNGPSQPTSTASTNSSAHQDKNDQGSKDDNGNGDDNGAGDRQYAVTICHHTSSATNPWVELTLSPQGAANHLKNHPEDFIVTPTTPCPPTG